MIRAPAARVPPPSVRGLLERTPLAHILVHALEKKLSGTLVLKGPGAAEDSAESVEPIVPPRPPMSAAKAESAAICLAGGFITKAKTSEATVHLGRVLLELGYVTSEALDESLRTLARKRTLQGKLLVANGTITKEQLQHGLRTQLFQKLAYCFELKAASTFGFFEGVDLLTDLPTDNMPPLDPLAAIWRGICANPSWSHVNDVLARVGDKAVRLVHGTDAARFAFPHDVASAVMRLRVQPTRVAELEAASVLPANLAKLVVYCLFLTRQLVPVETASAALSGPSGPSIPSAPSTPSTPSAPSSAPGPKPSAPPTSPSNRSGPSMWEGLTSSRTTLTARPPARVSVAPSPASTSAPSSPPAAASSPRFMTRPLAASDDESPDTFRRAEACLADRDFRGAENHCRRGSEASPKDFRYPALVALIEARKPEGATSIPLAGCIAMLDAVIAQDGTCERAFHYRALLHKMAKRDAFAIRDFRRAAELDPDNAEALREVVAHDRRARMP